MKRTGVVRRIENVGRIVIPMEYRKVLGIEPKDPLEMLIIENKIVLRKYDKDSASNDSTGVVRNIENVGRIVIPMEFRKVLNISAQDLIEISIENSCIVLSKYEPNCLLCGNTNDIIEFNDKLICRSCIEKLKAL